MNREYPFWYKLLLGWCQEMNRYGLTIPFIIGVHKIDSIKPYFKSPITIEGLIQHIIEYSSNEKIILRYCYDLEAWVLDLDNKQHPLEHYCNKVGNLLLHDDVLERFNSLGEFITSIEHEYSSLILNELFSRSKSSKKWHPYDDKDVAIITKFFFS